MIRKSIIFINLLILTIDLIGGVKMYKFKSLSILLLFLILTGCSPDPNQAELIGEQNYVVEVGIPFVDPGLNAFSYENFDVEVDGIVNSSMLGEYVIVYRLHSNGNHLHSLERVVKVVDSTPPELVLIGEELVNLRLGQAFDDPGLRATDNYDSSPIIGINSNLNVQVAGEYSIIYTVTDSSGNSSSITRRIVVSKIDLSDVLDLVATYVTIDLSNSYQLYFDVNDRLIYKQVGLYGFRYEEPIQNLLGQNYESVIAKVIEYDTLMSNSLLRPVINIMGSPITNRRFSDYILSVNDSELILYESSLFDLNLISNQLSLGSRNLGIQNLITDIINYSNNLFTLDVLSVMPNIQLLQVYEDENIYNIQNDTIPPKIYLLGSENPQNVFINTPYSELGAIIFDDTTIEPILEVDTSNLDTSALGLYFVKYTATDKAGNQSSVYRSVNVIEIRTNPVVVNNGFLDMTSYETVYQIELGKHYSFTHYFPRNTVQPNLLPVLYFVVEGLTSTDSYVCWINDNAFLNGEVGSCGFMYEMDDFNSLTKRTGKVVYAAKMGRSIYDQFDYLAGDKVVFDYLPDQNIDDAASSIPYKPGRIYFKLSGEFINDYTVRYHFNSDWIEYDLNDTVFDNSSTGEWLFKILIPGYGQRYDRYDSLVINNTYSIKR